MKCIVYGCSRGTHVFHADCTLVMSQVNFEPRGSLAWMTPTEALRTAFGDTANALVDAFGIEELGMGAARPDVVLRRTRTRGEG
ncbi:MAG: hypothetical protein J6D54_10570 [Olsenella sp.]|nr:hypothetical protein [Olsenella sp.]